MFFFQCKYAIANKGLQSPNLPVLSLKPVTKVKGRIKN
jgi:hypothetical protein